MNVVEALLIIEILQELLFSNCVKEAVYLYFMLEFQHQNAFDFGITHLKQLFCLFKGLYRHYSVCHKTNSVFVNYSLHFIHIYRQHNGNIV